MTDIIVTIDHARRAKIAGQGVLCAPGIRAWFTQHGLSLTDFLQHGLPASRLLETKCPFAQRAVAIAKEDLQNGEQ